MPYSFFQSVMHCIFSIKYICVTKTPTFHICFVCQANRGKDMYVKYIDSVLQKSAKIRSLIGDLQKNYPQDQTAMKFLSLVSSKRQPT